MRLDPQTETQARLLADSNNRAILTILEEAERPLDLEELAERLVSREVTVVSTDEFERRTERVQLELHHDRLPRLADARLVEYDRQRNAVGGVDGVSPDGQYHEEATIEDLLCHLPRYPESGAPEARRIEGRASIIESGRRLADAAEEELFCMYVSTDLLEEECVQRARRAIDRGVTMYMGSGNAAVRDLTRRELPEAIIWEPQLDWLNDPTHPRIGRLVLVDRREAMLALLQEPANGGSSHEETAVVGSGEEHPLVVLVRDLLGERLDHLDNQNESFRCELRS